MEPSNSGNQVDRHNNVNSYLAEAAQKLSINAGDSLYGFTSATTLVSEVAIENMAKDLKEGTELKPEFDSLKRSLERLQKYEKRYDDPTESPNNSSDMHPEPMSSWQEEKYNVLRRISVTLLSSK
ncbi:hypothetical protein SGCOL_005639 [Colletotrichum sp. CLE4]